MSLELHYAVHCKNCGGPMWLPAQMIQQLFVDRDDPPNDDYAIAVVCAPCKHAETYFLHRDSEKHNPKDMVVLAEYPRYGDIYLVAMLECEVEACKSHVPLFAHWSPAMTPDQKLADTTHWKVGDLVCPKGHGFHLPDFAPSRPPGISN